MASSMARRQRRVDVNHLAQHGDRDLSVDCYRERAEHFTAGSPGRGGSERLGQFHAIYAAPGPVIARSCQRVPLFSGWRFLYQVRAGIHGACQLLPACTRSSEMPFLEATG